MALPTKREERRMRHLQSLRLERIFAPSYGIKWPEVKIPKALTDKWWKEVAGKGLSAYGEFMARVWKYVHQQRGGDRYYGEE